MVMAQGRRKSMATVCLVLFGAGALALRQTPAVCGDGSESLKAPYRSPWGVAVSPDASTIYVSDATAGCVEVLNMSGDMQHTAIALQGTPLGLCLSPDNTALFVAERGAGTVAVIDTATLTVNERLAVGRWPVAVALAPTSKRLVVCNQDSDTVSGIDLAQDPPKRLEDVRVGRSPASAAITPDERLAIVANQLPMGVSTDPTLAAEVSIIDLEALKPCATIKLPPGSSVVNGVCTSPDGNWAYLVHGLGHFNLPMTQLERGWVNTYALTIIDIDAKSLRATLLLDDLTQGAADPFSVVCAPDGSRLWISHTGVHEVSAVEIARVHELLEGNVSGEVAQITDGSLPNIWLRIQQDQNAVKELSYDLTALYIAQAIHRAPSGGKGPRGLALTPDGKTLLVANYFSGSVAALDTASGQLRGVIWQGDQPKPDPVRRGELVFHDATRAFQRWHSCATCHPNDGRVDGLRWDFADDGFGNGMNTPAIHYPDKTEPLHRQGTLATTPILAKHGLTFTHLIVPTEEEVEDLVAYMISLHPEPSPYRTVGGEFTPAARRGRKIFADKAQCATCHKEPYFTDQQLYEVGVITPNYPDAKYKTPPLFELHRTAPYLHDGRAASLQEVLTTYNPDDKHGKTSDLSADELDDLVAYLLEL
jgi:YVTN family beta-propeller protein